ncbi:MAG: hypothetical protein ACP5N1_03430 [Candidatus Woesearchaeota archaeon]
MTNKDIFLKAINDKKIVTVEFNALEKGVIIRRCIPFDYGVSRRYKDDRERYHFYDLNSPDGQHNLSIPPEQVITIVETGDSFKPEDYVTWTPAWIYPRDWGEYS